MTDDTKETNPYAADNAEARAERDKAKDAHKVTRDRLTEVEAELTAIQDAEATAKTSAEEEKQRLSGDYDKLKAKHDTELATAKGELAAAHKAQRRSDFIRAIDGKVPFGGDKLESLMLLAEKRGVDTSPEKFGEDEITDVITRLRGYDPDGWKTEDKGFAPAGSGTAPLTEKEKARAIARAVSPGRQRKA